MYLQHCSYEESYEGEDNQHFYTFTGPCVVTGELHSVKVKGPDLFKYQHGGRISECFPYLSVGDREFIISGTSPDGWDEMFG